MTDTLKPCPFCGAIARIESLQNKDGSYESFIQCGQCCARTDGFVIVDKSEANTAFFEQVMGDWNRRADTACDTPTPSEPMAKFIEKAQWNDVFAQGFDAGFNSDDHPDHALAEALKDAAWAMVNQPSCQRGASDPCKCKDCVLGRIGPLLSEAQQRQHDEIRVQFEVEADSFGLESQGDA